MCRVWWLNYACAGSLPRHPSNDLPGQGATWGPCPPSRPCSMALLLHRQACLVRHTPLRTPDGSCSTTSSSSSPGSSDSEVTVCVGAKLSLALALRPLNSATGEAPWFGMAVRSWGQGHTRVTARPVEFHWAPRERAFGEPCSPLRTAGMQKGGCRGPRMGLGGRAEGDSFPRRSGRAATAASSGDPGAPLGRLSSAPSRDPMQGLTHAGWGGMRLARPCQKPYHRRRSDSNGARTAQHAPSSKQLLTGPRGPTDAPTLALPLFPCHSWSLKRESMR